MKLYVLALVFALASLIAGTAHAQDGVYYPGSVWTSNGTLSPVEKGNVLSLTHAEQGVALHGVELFGQATFSADSKGFDWNRRYIGGAGARFTQSVGTGMIRFSGSFIRERRYTSEVTAQGFVFAAEAWFGWNNAPKPARP